MDLQINKNDRINWTTSFAKVAGLKTAIYSSDVPLNHEKTALLVHGINGSHYGLMSVANEMLDSGWRIIMVDLPGHGASDIPDWSDLQGLQNWFNELVKVVSKNFGHLSKIVAHSFGCYSVRPVSAAEIVFVNPVPHISGLYKHSASLAKILYLPGASAVYDWVPFSALRGFLLQSKYSRSRETWNRQHLVAGKDSKTSAKKRQFQTKLAEICRVDNPFKGFAPDKVIMGSEDKMSLDRSAQQMQKTFPSSKIIEIRGGHLLPIENPAGLCAKILL